MNPQKKKIDDSVPVIVTRSLAELPFEFSAEEHKIATHKVRKWWHPDKVTQHTVEERKQDPEASGKDIRLTPEEEEWANKNFV